MDEHRSHSAWSPLAASVPPPVAWYQPWPSAAAPTYAGFWRRFLAGGIDGFVVGLVHYPLASILDNSLARAFETSAYSDSLWLVLLVWLAASVLLSVVLGWLYCAGLESSSWRATLGKRALGMTVTNLAGGRVSFGRATGRYFAHFVSDFTLGIGYLIQPFTARRQALHDLIAGTLVVRT